MWALAAGELDEEAIAKWFRSRIEPRRTGEVGETQRFHIEAVSPESRDRLFPRPHLPGEGGNAQTQIRSSQVAAELLLDHLDHRAAPGTRQPGNVIESAAPRDADLTLAEEPLLRVGIVDGPLEYIFGNVTGAVRLEDGSIVVADEQSGNLRRFDANGRPRLDQRTVGRGSGRVRGAPASRELPPGAAHRLRLESGPHH